MQANDVVIIGGGVIGLTTAYFLAKDGGRVAIIERGAVGKEASWAGAGIIPPSSRTAARTPFDRLRAIGHDFFPALSAELSQRTGIDNGYWVCGGLELGGGHEPADEEWRGEGVACQALTAEAARDLEPTLAPDAGPAFLLPELAQLRNPWHMRALESACAALQVSFHTDLEVQGFKTAGNRIDAAVTNQGEVHGDRFLIAAGAWSEHLLHQLGWQPGIRPIRGQIALLKPEETLLRHVILAGAQYIVPRRDGYVLVGSTEEDCGFDKRTTAQGIDQLLRLAMRLVPALARANIEKTWAGLRPGSPDGLPFLGRVPAWDNIWVGAGHFRAGIQLSPGSALLLKQMLLDQPAAMDTTPFRLDR